MSKKFDNILRLQSDRRKKWVQEVRRERLHGTVYGWSSALRLASSSLGCVIPRPNEGPGIHCRLIVEKERKDSSCQIKSESVR